MEIGLAATVVGQDGDEVGRVRAALVDPLTGLLSHVVVAGGQRDDEQRAIPIWAIERGEAAEIFLKEDAPAVEEFPEYRRRRQPHAQQHEPDTLGHEPGDFPSLFPEDSSLPANAVALTEGTTIACHGGGRAGNVVAVEADDYTAEITLLYASLDQRPRRTVAVPTAWARSFTAERIVLECTHGDLASLPVHDTGAEESPIEPLQQG